MIARLSVAPPFSPRVDPGLERLLAQVAARREVQERLDRRARQRDGVLAGEAALLGGGARRGAGEIGQPGEIALARAPAPGLLVGQHVLPELRCRGGQPLVDRRQPRPAPAASSRAPARTKSGVVASSTRACSASRPSDARAARRSASMRAKSAAVEVDRVAVARRAAARPRARPPRAHRWCRRRPARRTDWRRGRESDRRAPAPRWCCRRSAPPCWRRSHRSRRGCLPKRGRRPRGSDRA